MSRGCVETEVCCKGRTAYCRSSPALRVLESAPLSNHVTEAVLKQSSVAEAIAPTIEVAPALRVLESEAREFLIAQGIRTVEAFLSTRSETMADALIDWRAQSKKEP
jgi:hypothetical protein